MTQSTNEAQIRMLVESWAKAVRAKDMDSVLANHTDDKKTWELFFDNSPDGPGSFEVTELRITAGETVAYCHAILKILDSKGRLTIGMRKEDRRWLIAHEHHSYPIELE